MTDSQRELLRSAPDPGSLVDEISLARLQIAELLERAQAPGPDGLLAISYLTRLFGALTRMIHLHLKLGPTSEDEFAEIAELARQRMVKARENLEDASRTSAGLLG